MSRGPRSGGLHETGERFWAAFPGRVQEVGQRARIGPDGEERSSVEVVDLESRVDEVVARPFSAEVTRDPFLTRRKDWVTGEKPTNG